MRCDDVMAGQVKVGQRVRASDQLLMVSAMKLEVQVKVPDLGGGAEKEYVVDAIPVSKDMEVVENALLVKLREV